MNSPEEEFDDLQALFDATAEDASGPLLTKLRARAAEVPERARRRPWWRTFGLAAPATAAALAGALAVMALPGTPEPLASFRAPIVPEALAAARPAPVVEEPVASADDEEALTALAFDESPSGFALDPMYAPTSDAELDAWLDATEGLLDEGG